MNIKIIQEKLERYNCISAQEEDHAIKEITQEVVLFHLSQAGFFKKAAFLGGTSLRILHGLMRFSEDLDFALLQPDLSFSLNSFLPPLKEQMKAFGYDITVSEKTRSAAVQSAFLKDNSIQHILNAKFPKTTGPNKTLKIKLEIDTNPPQNPTIELNTLNFPIQYNLASYDIPTLFAGKIHALLCRPYLKGRDWFDFLWYVGRIQKPNFTFLSNALNQVGPWQSKNTIADLNWLSEAMERKIKEINWNQAKIDVQRFLNPSTVKSLELWDQDFFLGALRNLIEKLK